MKILRIRFKNLNSLAGEWSIDLTHNAYLSEGIFAITGPTGAGKTTILDAICLALYGRTPRLAVLSKSQNDIITRATSDCLAEAEIETAKGAYCFCWSQRRARENTKYEFQDARHEIIDMQTNTVISDKKREVDKLVEEITGMDFDRFTKSMLLAQGGFDAFLKASPDDRRNILEKITGSEKYETLTNYIHERKRQEENRLDSLRNELTGISPLDTKDEREKIEELARRQEAAISLARKKEQVIRIHEWRINLDNLLAEKNGLEKELADIRHDEENFREDAVRLERGKTASLIAADYNNLTGLKSECDVKEQELARQNELLSKVYGSCETQKKEVEKCIMEHDAAKKRQAEAQPLLRRIRALDQRIIDKQKGLLEQQYDFRKEQREIVEKDQEIKKTAEELDSLRKSAAQISSWLKANAADEWLVQGLTGIIAKFDSLIKDREIILKKKDKLDKARKEKKESAEELEKIEDSCKKTRKLLQNSAIELQQRKDRLNTLLAGRELRDYRTEKEDLYVEKSRLLHIASFDEERKKLEPDYPCPLCGSLKHPFAINQIPTMGETDKKIEKLAALIDEAEKLEKDIIKRENGQNAIQANFKDLEKREAILKASMKESGKIIDDILAERESLIAAKKQSEDEVLESLAPLGVTKLKDLNALREELVARKKDWMDRDGEAQKINKSIQDATAVLQTNQALIHEKKSNLRNKLALLESMKKDLDEFQKERFQAFGNDDPDQAEKKLETDTVTSEKKREQAECRQKDLDFQFHEIKTLAKTLQTDLQSKSAELESKSLQFASTCLEMGFADGEDFIRALIDPVELGRLEEASQMLATRRAALEGRQKDVEQKLSRQRELHHTDESQEMLANVLASMENEIATNLQAIALLQNALNENEKTKAKLREKQADLGALEIEAMRWRELHELMGKGTGKNFRGFVQSLTFEILVRHANLQLCKLTDRYLLKMGEKGEEKKQLQFKVIDSYQGGEERSVANLSGGESFMISLALALGLSCITSENVKVDSLFLDEGFGTLDDEALDMALETLASLRQDGKMIGIISHVGALKERVSTQIAVTPMTGGRSAISGPGCSRA